jgi:hypothetical protein
MEQSQFCLARLPAASITRVRYNLGYTEAREFAS